MHRSTSETYDMECRAQDRSKGNREQSRVGPFYTVEPACVGYGCGWVGSGELGVFGGCFVGGFS